MEIQTTNLSAEAVLIQISGRYDYYEAPTVHAVGLAQLEAGKCQFIMDLRAVTFIDSAGLAELVSLLKRARAKNGDVSLIPPLGEAAAQVLIMTRFDVVFTYATPEQFVQKGGGDDTNPDRG